MKALNLRVRLRNPIFIAQAILAILTPILAYAGLTMQDLTSWAALGNLLLGAISNPYVLGLVVVSLWNTVTDPTTPSWYDGPIGLSYTSPGVAEEDIED